MSQSLDVLNDALADRYLIERALGHGGMATVYLAQDSKHGRNVAVKVLRPELAASLGAERFIREITIAANLTHPHILSLYDSGHTGDFLYYVMPYIEGESLRDHLNREKRLPLNHVIRLTEQIAAALHYAHARGIVHRDVKPENIMLTDDQALVADFGIARAVSAAGGERLTATGLAIGTPDYMSPEQAFGASEVDARSDVYALGCVVYEMISGHAPFSGDTPQAVLAKHATERALGLRTIDSAVPLFAERAVERALAKSPSDRFASAAAFAEALTTGTVVPRVGRRRIAVLPPTNLTNDPEQSHLILGLHEALISQLGSTEVAVLARTSVLRYQGSDKPVRDIARELAVEAVIESSLFREDEAVGIQARLIDGNTEEGIWSGSYDGDVRNIFKLYRNLAGSIANEIQLALSPVQATTPDRRTIDPAAYENYMRGRVHAERFTPEDFISALKYFQAALNAVPDYAPAHAGIALVWSARVVLGLVPPLEGGPAWRDAAHRAVELDPDLAEGHWVLASDYAWFEWDWERAEEAFQRSIELDPNNPQTRTFYSHFLTAMKRADEGAAQIERALEIDPFNPFHHSMYGMQLMHSGRYDEALAQLSKALEMAPNNVLARIALFASSLGKGQLVDAAKHYGEFYAVLGNTAVSEVLLSADAEANAQQAFLRAAEILAEQSRTVFIKPIHVAILFEWGADIDRAIEWLKTAYDLRDHDMTYLAVIPHTEEMTVDPRYHDMLRRMKLPLPESTT